MQPEDTFDPLLESRMQIPQAPPNAVSRAGLIARIEDGMYEAVVLHAGAGCGKTVVMAEFARKHEDCCGWYQMQASDNEPVNFLRGICSLAAGNGMRHIPVFEENGQKQEDIAQKYLRFLSVFLLERKEIFYICLDDFQVITEEQVYAFIVELMECGRGKIRLIFAVRGEFPPFLAAYLLQGRVIVMCSDELCFAGNETGELLRGLVREELSAKQIKSVQEYTKGWPAGIVFAGLGMKSSQRGGGSGSFFDPTYLNAYFFYEIFRNLSNEIQTFLVGSSVLEEIDAAVCDYVLERTDSGHMLEVLARRKLFLLKQKEKQECYCYHPMFAGFLRERIPAERRERLRFRAVQYADSHRGILHVECLGQFTVTGAGEKISWRTQKTKELFACLFFREGRGTTKEVLMEALWPEADGERATVLFHTTVSYLRKALMQAGAEKLLVVENQTYAVDISGIESDIGKLMRWNCMARKGSIPENADSQEAAELYRECYMCGEDYPWLGEHREYIERLFIQTMGGLAEIEIGNRKYRKAALLLEKAAEIDSYEISILGLLVECLLLTGDIKAAKYQYARIRKICEDELCQKPVLEFGDYVRRAGERWGNSRC